MQKIRYAGTLTVSGLRSSRMAFVSSVQEEHPSERKRNKGYQRDAGEVFFLGKEQQ